MQLVTQRSAGTQAVLLDWDLARAEVVQSHLYENPSVDLTWATIPVGESNPPGLSSPYTNVPNYGVGVAYRFLIGKRGPRQQRAIALEESAKATSVARVRGLALDLIRTIGGMAVATMRADGARGILDDARRSVELAKTRLGATFGTPLDVDRLEIEASRVQLVIARSQGEIASARAICSSIIGLQCGAFEDSSAAREFLQAWVLRGARVPLFHVEDRADLRALEAGRRAAEAERDLAQAMKIPDPTVRVGFVHDRFVVSGNQQNSFNVMVGAPIPLFDSGQAIRRAAEARRDRLSALRAHLVEASKSRIPALRETLAVQRGRQSTIANEILPRARAVLADLERAANARLVALTDVIQARRTLNELSVEEAESLGAAFDASIELIAQLPENAAVPDAQLDGSPSGGSP